MIWGDQWLCPCGTHNLFVRKKCRDCGEPQLPNEKFVTVFEALANAKADKIIEANYNPRGKPDSGEP